MKRVIRITAKQFNEAIDKKLSEMKQEISNISKDILLVSYYMDNDSDKRFISERVNEIYNILYSSYKEKGGIQGLNKAKDIIKKSNIIRLALYDNTIVSVATYSDYLGGNKLMFCGAIDGELHRQGVIGLRSIVQNDSEQPQNWNWIEASGRVEDIFNEYKAYNVPSKYAKIILKKPVTVVDEYHYSRPIGVNKINFVKTIFGIKNKEILNTIFRECFGYMEEDINKAFHKLRNSQRMKTETIDNKITPELNFAYHIVVLFEEAFKDFHIHEMPEHIIKCLRLAYKYLTEADQNNIYV